MKQYCVYMHLFPNAKIYIGITCKKPSDRWVNGKGYVNSRLMTNAIKKYGWDNIEHIILDMNLSREECEKKEIEYIKFYQTQDTTYGYNILPGGKLGREGLTHTTSQETKDKMSLAWGSRIVSQDTKDRMRASQMGHTMSQESIDKMLATRKLRPRKPKPKKEKILLVRGKAVQQIDLTTGEVIQEWKNTKEASDTLGIRQPGISKCCNGKLNHTMGFGWKYA